MHVVEISRAHTLTLTHTHLYLISNLSDPKQISLIYLPQHAHEEHRRSQTRSDAG